MSAEVSMTKDEPPCYMQVARKSSVPVPIGYKKTEFGLIPEDWKIEKISDLSSVATGSTPPTDDRSNYGDEFLFVSPTDMGTRKHINSTEKMLSKKGFSISRKFPEKSVLFVCIGSTIGKCGIAPFELTSNQQINVVLPSSSFCSDFMYYALCFSSLRIKEQAGEQAVPLINKTQFSANRIPLPPKPEQRVIATALSDADALLKELDNLIAKKRNLKQAVMQQLLTGKTRLPGFEGEWEIKTLGELLEWLGNGAVYKPVGRGGVPITRIETIANGYIDHERVGSAAFDKSLNNYRLQSGDIIFSHINSVDHIGKVAMVSEEDLPLYHGMNLLLIRTSSLCNPRFLFYWLESERSRKKMRTLAKQAVSQASINTSELRQVEIFLPNSAEQIAIAAALSAMATEMDSLQQRRAKTAALKQAMMQELLTGRTRLMVPGDPR